VILYGRCSSQRWRTHSHLQTGAPQRSAAGIFAGAWGAAPGGLGDLRATDAARERTAAILRQALVDATEHRLAATYAAQHNRELGALIADLPHSDHSAVFAGATRSQRGLEWPVAVLFAVVVIAWAAVLVFGWQHGAWPVWLLAFIVLRALWWRGRWRGGQRGFALRPPARPAG
jgi:Flp pilus assembly protein TadB